MANNVVSKIQLSGTTTYDIRDAALSAVNGIVKCNGSGTLAAAVEGTDYQAPLTQNQTIWYGECSTAQATKAKTATIANLTAMSPGLHVAIKFAEVQRASSPTLNINNLGAKPIKRYGTTAAANYEWIAGSVIEFVYDGTNWMMLDGRVATTSYYGVTRLNSSATNTSESYALTPKALNNFWLSCISPFPSYTTADAYDVGDYVRYDYHIYRCTAAIPSGTAWSVASSSVEAQPTFWEMIQDLSTDVDAKADLTALNSKADLTALNGKADWNMLDIASPTVTSNAFTLSSNIGIYRVTATVAGGAATVPVPSVTNIPARQSYFCFDMEVAIGAAATSLVGPSGWAWCEDGELPISDFAGKTLYISVRFDCQARTFLANVWRIA